MRIAFCGHREIYQSTIREKTENVINRLLQTDNKFVFFSGGMGNFDDICSSVVRNAKYRYPHLDITLTLVLPYMSNRLNTEKEYYEYNYDEIIIPAELDNAHYKNVIQKRNRWMIDRSDYVIAYIHREFGGAFETVKYARKQGKAIIYVAESV